MCINMSLLLLATVRGTLSPARGVGWEFWALWLNLGMLQGMLEAACLSCRPSARPITLYCTAMVLNHLPVLSERMDTAKDQIFVAMAIHEGYVFLGCSMGLWLIGCQTYFACDPVVRVELMETWLPILTAGTES